MNICKRVLLLSVVSGLILLLAHCGGGDKPATQAPAGDSASDSAQLVALVRETVERLRYSDKSGLYENEFEYLREKETFDDYIRHGEVSWANVDSLDSIQVIGVTLFGHDSAHLTVLYHVPAAPGQVQTPRPSMMAAYWHQGHWIKPYMSSFARQREYEELIRQAEEDSEE